LGYPSFSEVIMMAESLDIALKDNDLGGKGTKLVKYDLYAVLFAAGNHKDSPIGMACIPARSRKEAYNIYVDATHLTYDVPIESIPADIVKKNKIDYLNDAYILDILKVEIAGWDITVTPAEEVEETCFYHTKW
jgi:hypothetical protein